MRRLWTVVVVGALSLALAGCNAGQGAAGGAPSEAQAAQEQKGQIAVAGTPEEILELMQEDFNETAQKLYDEQATLFETVGDTYDGYVANVGEIQEWYELTVTETEALGERAQENSRAYFQAVIDSVDPEDDDALSDAIEAYYDAIYDDAYGDYYSAIYDDLYSDIFDRYYSGVLSDAFDSVDYSEAYETMSNEYDLYSDGHSGVYDAISDARSEIYDISSEAWSAYYDHEFTIDNIFRESVIDVERNEE